MENQNEKKQRLEEILEAAQKDQTSTEELLDLLDESIKIGNDICEESQNAIKSSFSSEDQNSDEDIAGEE